MPGQDDTTTSCCSVIFVLQLLSTVAVSVVFSLLTLYLLYQQHWSQVDTYNFVAAYNALGYATSILGGWLAERFLGYRFAVLLSSVLGASGLLLLELPFPGALQIGLAAFSVAYGMMVPAMFVLLGRLHSMHDSVRREQGFMLAYIAMDVGAFIAALLAGVISTRWGYGLAFLLAAVCHLCVWPVLLRYRRRFVPRQTSATSTRQQRSAARAWGLLILVACLPLFAWLLEHARWCNGLLLAMGVGCVLVILYYARQQPNTDKAKLLLFLALLMISTTFDLSYFLNASVVTVFTEANVNRTVGGLTVPTATYAALNPLFVVLAGPWVGRLYTRLSRGASVPSFQQRFAIGIVLMGLGYLVMMLGAQLAPAGQRVASAWLVGGCLLQTLGELFISPTAYAMVGVLVPRSLEGVMMGICQFSSGVAGAMSGFMANWLAPPETFASFTTSNLWYSHHFAWLGVGAVMLGVAVACLALLLRGKSHALQSTQGYTPAMSLE